MLLGCRLRDESALKWYTLTLAYTAAKWPYAAPNHRKSIAEALTDATEAMLATDEPPYSIEGIRRALRTWAFSDRLRGATEPPEDLLALDDALSKLAEKEPAKAELVKLRYFGGLSLDEAATCLGISLTTAKRYWIVARASLFATLSQGDSSARH